MHKSPARSTRTRSQMGKEAEAKSADEEMAPNVNGNKDGVKEETTTAAPAESTPAVAAEEEKQEAAQSEVSSRVTRKRKLADIKSEEEDNKETATKEPETKQKPTTESVIVKEEPLNEATDSSQTSVESVEVKVETPTISTVAESTNNSISNDLKDIEIGIQTFGKGKRARVPNKRYSDISRVTPRAKAEHSPRKSQAAKNGEFPDDDLGEILREESEAAEFKEQAPVARRSLASSASAKKAKPTFDSTNPAYLKPFKFGWKRELVFRSTFTDGKRNGDIYYYTPTGKKVRSMREVAENLKNRELSINDFTFFKEPIGLDDPEKEIIRDAKKIGGSSGSGRIYSKNIAPAKLGMKKKRTKTSSVSSGSSPPAVPAPATKSKLKSSFKVKVPTKKMKKSRREMSNPAQTDAALMSPSANPSPAKKSKLNSKRNADFSKSSASTAKLPVRSSERMANKAPPVQQMQNHLQNLAYGYKTLFYVFQYLKVQDLLRAGCVCTMWRDMARHPLLWRTVRMKNSQIHSFEGLANALEEHGTVHLDLRKMLLPANQSSDDIWPTFTNAIKKVKSLRRIELCRCLASVVEDLARNNHNLEVINAVTIKCETMTLQPLEKLTNLVDLRLKSTAGLTLTSDLSALKELTKLKHLSITSIKDLNKLNIEVIGELTNLEVLDLGECTDFPKKFGPEILSRLVNLEKLRLEKGHGECHTFDILNAVKDLPCLHQLELVNFDIKTGFDKALGACFNITKLLIIPTYVSQSATTNHMVLGGVLRLQKTLSHFVWGVTLELLRVTELFVDQCEQPDKKDREKGANSGDSIPVLKPVPLHGIQQPELPTTSDTPQVEILPLPNLQKLLLQNLPTTRVKILKIPFHATWRQSITDSVN